MHKGTGWLAAVVALVAAMAAPATALAAQDMYRLYNPNARSGSHNYTTNGSERDWLVSLGWRDEGLAWYALGPGRADPNADKPAPSNPGTGGGSSSQGGGSTVTNVVYYTPNGGRYHKTASCKTLRHSKTILPASLTDAQQMGLKPCKVCWH